MTPSRFVQWWQANPDKADEIKRRRREKYQDDPEFREKEKARKRKSTKPSRRLPKPRLFHHEGEDFIAWSVGKVAEFLGVHKRTISNLEAKGTIPTNRLIDNHGRRWWPEGYIRWLKPFFDLKNSREITSKEFSRRVWGEWGRSTTAGLFPVLAIARRTRHDDPEKEEEERDIEEQEAKRQRCSLEEVLDGLRGADHCASEPHSQDRRRGRGVGS